MSSPRLSLSGFPRLLRLPQTRHSSSSSSSSSSSTLTPPPRPHHDPHVLLSKPTWSIRALLPPTSPSEQAHPAEITPAQLSHLLRLSALPQPASHSQTTALLTTLHAQLHFVRNIQSVNTAGVTPLDSIRDETPEGMQEATITVETLKQALADEEVYGRCKRPRRRRNTDTGVVTEGVEDWDVLGLAQEKVGRYFVVRSGNGRAKES